MKVAVAYKDGKVCEKFEDVVKFRVYNIDDGKIISCMTVGINGEGTNAFTALLKHHDIDHLICGSMMEGVEEAAAEKSVKIHNGASGKADDTVKALLNGELL